MVRQLTGTVGVQLVAVSLAALVIPIAARHWSPAVFGQYVVTYRMLALVQPALSLSANVSVTRYIARLRNSSPSAAASVMVAASRLLLVPIAGFALVLTVFSDPVGRVVFGEPRTGELIIALAALTIGSVVWTIVISALQGVFRIALANVLFVVCTGLVPLVGVLVLPFPAAALMFTAVLWLLCGLGFTVPILASPDPVIVRQAASGLFHFGIRRVPGEIAAFGLFAVPPIVTAKMSGIAAAGFVSLAMSMVTLGGSLCSPISTVLLPHMSAEFAGDRRGRLRSVGRLVLVVNVVVVVGSGVVFALLPVILRVALGHAYVSAVDSVRIACFAVPAYSLYVTVRSILDALYDQAVTMRYTVAGFGAFVIGVVVLRSAGIAHSELLAFDLGVWVLAILTLRRTIVVMRSHASYPSPGETAAFDE